LAETCAAESIVLLENDGILPLNPNTPVTIIGDFAEKARYQGAGSSLVNPTMLTNLRDWLNQAELKLAEYAPGYRRGQAEVDPRLLAEATEAARKAKVVLLCIGLDETAESEGADREHMHLPAPQLALLEAVCKANANVVLVLSGGSPFVLPEGSYRAVIHGYLGGQAGAAAMARALAGKVNPSGHLAETWPLCLEDTPTAGNFPATGFTAEHREGIYIGYRYYETANLPVRYPFGHGLSYTSFAYSDLQADGQKVSFTLTNTGKMAGAEVAQVYITCRTGKVLRAKKELKGFQKVYLEPGESHRVTISLDDKAFRYFNTLTNRFETETANYDILVGSSVRDIRLSTTIRVFGTDAEVPAMPECYRTAQIRNVSDEDFAALLGHPIPEKPYGQELTKLDTISRFPDAKNPLARWIGRSVGRRIEKARKKGDPAPTTLYIYNLPIRGLAQMTQGHVTRAMAEDVLLWVNGHGFKGVFRFGRDYFRGRKAAREFEKSLKGKK
jgi:beta-glucosidase